MYYNELELKDNVIFNYVVLMSGEETSTQLEKTLQNDYVPTWDDFGSEQGFLILDFNGNLISSDISELEIEFTSWNIYKKKERRKYRNICCESS